MMGNWTDEDLYDVDVWLERDRACVHLYAGDPNHTVAEWWDEDVLSLVEDGFLDPRDWRGSAVAYAADLGLIDRATDGA